MHHRRLSTEERALWAKVVASVRPLRLTERAKHLLPPVSKAASVRAERAQPGAALPKQAMTTETKPGTNLDSSWDRRLGRGTVEPEMSIDLHGHNLATAYALLDDRLDQAIRRGIRVVLLITGKPPGGEIPVIRGRIRAAIGDWLAASRHAGDIAAVRNAHPCHGGPGALYIILRRRRIMKTKW